MSDLVNLIKEYYDYRDLKWPNFDSAMKFVQTEIAEVYELDLAREGGWVRNNPQNKPTYNKEDMAKELGDCIMMLVVAGIAEGVDPIEALTNKINKKMGKL
jgi:NTP pyrophosphatase (non-canonical NTP hydrolase)